MNACTERHSFPLELHSTVGPLRYCISCMTRQADCRPGPWIVTDRRMDFKIPALLQGTVVKPHKMDFFFFLWVCFSLGGPFLTNHTRVICVYHNWVCSLTPSAPPTETIAAEEQKHTLITSCMIRAAAVSHQLTSTHTWQCCSLGHQLHHGIVGIKSISCRESNQVDEFAAGIIIPTANRLSAINHGKSQ